MIRLKGLALTKEQSDLILSIDKESYSCKRSKKEPDLFSCKNITEDIRQFNEDKKKEQANRRKHRKEKAELIRKDPSITFEEENQARSEVLADLRTEMFGNLAQQRQLEKINKSIEDENIALGFDIENIHHENQHLRHFKNQFKKDMRGHKIIQKPHDNLLPIQAEQVPPQEEEDIIFRPTKRLPEPVVEPLEVIEERIRSKVPPDEEPTKPVMEAEDKQEIPDYITPTKEDIDAINRLTKQRTSKGELPIQENELALKTIHEEPNRQVLPYKYDYDSLEKMSLADLRSLPLMERNEVFRVLNISGKDKLRQFSKFQEQTFGSIF